MIINTLGILILTLLNAITPKSELISPIPPDNTPPPPHLLTIPELKKLTMLGATTQSPQPSPTVTPKIKTTPTPQPNNLETKTSPLPIASPSPKPTQTPTPTQTTVPSPQPTEQPTQKPTPSPTMPTYNITGPELDALFEKYAKQYNINIDQLKKIARCESKFNTNALNKKYGYAGLFQFSAGSWKEYRRLMYEDQNPNLRFNPEEAVKTASWMLSTGRASAWPSCQ